MVSGPSATGAATTEDRAANLRAMNLAALNVYASIRKEGHQKNVVGTMQTRDDLYKYLGYHDYEQKLDRLFAARRDAR